MSTPATAVATVDARATADARVEAASAHPGLARRAWLAVSAAFAAISGLLPHVLHHVGPLAGAALLGGALGSVLFGVLGFLVAIPFLLRLHSRFGNWRAPGIALAAFVVAFSVSTFVIGPAISGGDGDSGTQKGSAVEAPGPGTSSGAGGESDASGSSEGSGHASHH